MRVSEGKSLAVSNFPWGYHCTSAAHSVDRPWVTEHAGAAQVAFAVLQAERGNCAELGTFLASFHL